MSYIVVNPDDVTNICAAIDGIPDCTQLAEYAQKQTTMWLKQQQKVLEAQAKAAAKKVAPANIGEVITYLTTLANEAQQAYTDATAGIAEVIAAYATVSAKLVSKASEMTCTVPTIPSLPV